jgi:hypothetical protein
MIGSVLSAQFDRLVAGILQYLDDRRLRDIWHLHVARQSAAEHAAVQL